MLKYASSRPAECGEYAQGEVGICGRFRLGMPGMDGFEVARRLRAEPSLERTALIALTGYGQEEDVRRSLDAGFHHHITKSADFVMWRRLLDSVPGARR